MTNSIHLLKSPIDMFLVECPSSIHGCGFEAEADGLLGEIQKTFFGCEFRGVSLDRLTAVLEHGIDVYPTNEVIYATSFTDKAVEYGDWPKVLLVLRSEALKRTYRQVSSDISAEELERIREEFPTIIRSADGSQLSCTRLKPDSPQIATDYETHYAWWIPGDPWAAARAVLLLARPQDFEPLHAFVDSLRQMNSKVG